MKFRSQALAFALLAMLAAPSWADPDTSRAEREAARQAQREAKAERKRVRRFAGGKHQVEGDALTASVARVSSELAWHDDLDEARRAAIEANKPILYIQALGDLSGLL